MSSISRWAYLHNIEGCDIARIYTLNNVVEFVYLKEGTEKSLTINYAVYGGSMGFTETFECDSIPLPPAKKLHPLSGQLTHIKEMALYVDESGWEHYEELLCTTNNTTYLFYFSPDEEVTPYALFEKNKQPSLPYQEKKSASFPLELFSVDEFKEHLAFALEAHGEQKTAHGLPYSMHLLSVASEVIAALSVKPLSYDEHNVAIACALLHDVNEDTTTTITRNSSIAGHNEVIAKGVMALTKDKTLPKEAQMKDSINRLKQRQNCVAMVKLADRISNLGIPPKHWGDAKKREYLDEARLILRELGYANSYLANKLHEKIDAYAAYL